VILVNHPRIASGLSLGRVLDLGCGTGLVAMAIGDLPIESFTGVDLSPRMLAHARAKRIYAELREGDIIADLNSHSQRWPLITAADVLCYMGGLSRVMETGRCSGSVGTLTRKITSTKPSARLVSGCCAWIARPSGRKPSPTFRACC
jgi:SAM-dependent methyltransferase